MAEGASALGYQQVTYPAYPDLSRSAWRASLAREATDLGDFFGKIGIGTNRYSAWRERQLEDYNAKLNEYNSFLSTGAGMRASAESGDYSPAYYGASAGAGSASPLSYHQNQSDGAAEVFSGIRSLFEMFNMVNQIRNLSFKTEGQRLDNQAKEIDNTTRAAVNATKLAGLGYSADAQKMLNESELISRYGHLASGGILHYGQSDYDVGPETMKGNMYQRARADISALRSAETLRSSMSRLNDLNASGRRFFNENVLPVQARLLDGELDWQQAEKEIKLQADKRKISNSTIDTILDVVRTIFGIASPFVFRRSGSGSGSRFSYRDIQPNFADWE